MKFYLKLCLIISFILSITSFSKKHKFSRKTSNIQKLLHKGFISDVNQGGGSWQGGFECPEITIGPSESTQQKEGSGIFYADQIEYPSTTPEKLGWAFHMKKENPGINLKKILINYENSKIWYLPFSFISTDFQYNNKVGNKFLAATITNNNKEEFVLRVTLPKKKNSITDAEVKKIVEKLNQKKESNSQRSSKWKVTLTWKKEKEIDLDLKLTVSVKGKVRILSFKEPLNDDNNFKWIKQLKKGYTVQTFECDTKNFSGGDSIKIIVGNNSLVTKSLLNAGATVEVQNGQIRHPIVSVPPNGDPKFPFWYIGRVYRYGFILRNRLGHPVTAKPIDKRRRRKLRKM